MMELIVLGQIPGTGWQISFTTILLIWFAAWLAIRALRSFYRYHKFKTHLGQVAARYLLFMDKKTVKKRTTSRLPRKASSKGKSKKPLRATRQRLAKAHS